MKIDYEKLNRTHWFEDAEGNEVDKDDPKAEFYHHCFPCELNHKVDSYRYRPKNPVVKWLCKNDRFYSYMAKKYGKTFSQISLRFLIQKGVMPIPKSGSKEHMLDNMKMLQISNI